MSALLTTIERAAIQAGRRLGLSPEGVQQLQRSMVEELAIEHGGCEVHVPSLAFIKREERNASVVACWDQGMDAKANWQQHGIDKATYYRIIKKEQRRRQKAAQQAMVARPDNGAWP